MPPSRRIPASPPDASPSPAPPEDALLSELQAWSFALPESSIARRPPTVRGGSRLLVEDRAGVRCDAQFTDLRRWLRPGDLLVGNDTRVLPARLYAARPTGGRVELLVLGPGPGPVPAMVRPARRLRAGSVLVLADGTQATLCSDPHDGVVTVQLPDDPVALLGRLGEIPLPPYLDRAADADDAERYQTVYAQAPASAAAPTAGLHFTAAHLDALAADGIGFATVTLEVGIGTFRPLRADDLASGLLHAERWTVSAETATQVAATRAAGGRVVAIGTTSVRTLEAATPIGAAAPEPGSGTTRLFIRPGYGFRSVDALITNFHLPESSLLMLVGAFLGQERTLDAYRHAVASGYRFYSYGDAMLLL